MLNGCSSALGSSGADGVAELAHLLEAAGSAGNGASQKARD
jgi:hypothetical protein